MALNKRSPHIGRPLSVMVLGATLLAGCAVQVQNGSITFSILGGVFELTFNGIGAIQTQANQTVKIPTATRLFDQTPPQTPPTAQMTLPSSSVGVARRLTSKSIAQSQVLPLNGSALSVSG